MKRQSVISAVVIIMGVLSVSAYCQTAGMTLLLQQSPFEGGVITPSPGVHLFAPDTEIALIAIPKPGYQFVCWLGDVGDSTANRTITYLSEPKIIIAVFERCPNEKLIGGSGNSNTITTTGAVGGGGGFTSYSGGGGGGGGGFTPEPTPEPTPGPTPDPIPDPTPVPVPEPVTALMLSAG